MITQVMVLMRVAENPNVSDGNRHAATEHVHARLATSHRIQTALKNAMFLAGVRTPE
jgi:hypothetical protein